MKLNVTTSDAEETFRVGETLGRAIDVPLVIAMTGDLGSGKTVLAQGLAKGLAVPDEYYVTSPTYTLINEYPGRLPLVHVDLYRLAGGADLDDLGLHELLGGGGVVAIEWAERLHEQMLADHLELKIVSTGETTRHIRLSAYGQTPSILLRKLQNKLR